MIPEDFREEIIGNSIAFMKSITDAYGTEEGLKLWDTIADTLDPDLKGEVFFALLSGEYGGNITIRAVTIPYQKIPAIKALRSWDKNRMGLKEAKDAIEMVELQRKPFKFMVHAKDRHQAIKELRNTGCICS